jgi:hypothetical protein
MIATHALALSPSMVNAIQEGRKSTHRVAVAPQPINDRVGMVNGDYCRRPHLWFVDGLVSEYHSTGRDVPQWKCPYPPGTIVAIQEPWNREGGLTSLLADHDWIAEYAKAEPASYQARKANGTAPRWEDADAMPLEYSRLTLVITSVRAEQLQKISQDQAVAEGICYDKRTGKYWILDSEDHRDKQTKEPREAYCWLWESQGTPYMWRSNPWVWVLEFSVFEQDGSQ